MHVMLSRPLSWWIDKLVGCQAVKACPPALRRLGCLADKRQAVTRWGLLQVAD